MTTENGLPLLEPQPQQQQFPQTNVQVSPQGMAIIITLAAGVTITTALNEETMNEVCKMWVQTRKGVQDQLKLIQHISSSKVN